MTAMRRGVMEHMRRSLDTSAHVSSAIEVDMSRIVAARERLKQEYQASYGVNPTYLAFIAHATVATLKDYKWVNAEIRGETIVTRPWVNLGIAVALEDGKGLIVPVIRNAQDLNLLGMARAIADAQWNGHVASLLLTVLTCIAVGLSTIGLYAVWTILVARSLSRMESRP